MVFSYFIPFIVLIINHVSVFRVLFSSSQFIASCFSSFSFDDYFSCTRELFPDHVCSISMFEWPFTFHYNSTLSVIHSTLSHCQMDGMRTFAEHERSDVIGP